MRREIRRGHLGALRVGNQYRSTVSDLAKWLGEERFAELFSPLGVLSELIGQGNLSEIQATRGAQQAVAKVREKTPVTKKDWLKPLLLIKCVNVWVHDYRTSFNLSGSNSPRLCLEKISINANKPSAKFSRFHLIPRLLAAG